MPRPLQICGVIDCGRPRHGKGLCRIHYGEKVRKDAKRERSAKTADTAALTAKQGAS